MKEKIARMKYITKDNFDEFDRIDEEIKQNLKGGAEDEA